MRGVCLELVRPKRIVATERYDVPWYPGEAVGTITLDERQSKTVLTHTIRYESRAARNVVPQTQMEHAVALGYDRLEKLLVLESARRRKK